MKPMDLTGQKELAMVPCRESSRTSTHAGSMSEVHRNEAVSYFQLISWGKGTGWGLKGEMIRFSCHQVYFAADTEVTIK